MAQFCLLKPQIEKFKEGLRTGKINPKALSDMTSEQRRDFLADYVGKENAKQTNALFESKLLLKNQKAGMIAWAKKVGGISSAVRNDMISKINKLDKALSLREESDFLEDLVQTRLGLGVSDQEAKTIFNLSKKIEETKNKANKDGEFPSEKDRLEYGIAKVEMENYVNDLKLAAKKISFRNQPIEFTKDTILGVPGLMKSMLASLDNSFWGRQGIKTLLDVRTSHIWFKNFLKSWKDLAQQATAKNKGIFKGYDDVVLDAIKADIYSRPNNLNGKYKAGGYGLDVFTEEAFPSSIPERIPVLGRLFKASESAYNGAALRLRADLADRYIKIGEQNGLNMLKKEDAEGMGRLVGSLTGRGSLGKADVLSKEANALFFSIKFLKANLDTISAGLTDSKIRSNPVARKEAAKNLLNIVATLSSILSIANLIDPESVEEDPRSTNFGKIKIFGRWTDVTGGMAGLVVLASRLIPTKKDGEWSFWSKSSTGNYTNLLEKGMGKRNALDVFESFFEGKLSPFAGLLRDVWKGSDFDGEPVTVESALKKTLIPLPIQSSQKMLQDPQSSNVLASAILEGLGLSSGTPPQFKKDWSDNPTKAQAAFLEAVGEKNFKKANEEYVNAYNEWFNTTQQTEEFKNLSQEGKAKIQLKAKKELQDLIFEKYNFEYETPDKTESQEKEDDIIDNMIP